MSNPTRDDPIDRRRRSTSESGAGERLSSTLDEYGDPPGSLLESNIRLEPRSRSNQNLTVLRGSYYESPIGLGSGTGTLFDGRVSTADGVRAQILAEFNALKQRTDLWERQLSEQELTKADSELIANHLQQAITKLSLDAVCNRSDRFTSSEIKNLKDRIARTNRYADREFRDVHRGNNIQRNENDVFMNNARTNLGEMEPSITEESSLIDLSDDQDNIPNMAGPNLNPAQQSSESLNSTIRRQEEIVLNNLARFRDEPIQGFIPINEDRGISVLRSEILDKNKEIDERVGKLEFTILANNVRVGRLEERSKTVDMKLSALESAVSINKTRIDDVDNKITVVSEDWRRSQEKMKQTILDLDYQFRQCSTRTVDDEIKKRITTEIQQRLSDNYPIQAVRELRSKVAEIRDDMKIDQNVTENLRDLVIELKDQINTSIVNPRIGARYVSNSAPKQSGATTLHDVMKSARECEIIKNSINRSVGLIRQLIATDLDADKSDISLVKKCKLEDAPVVQKAIVATESALVKYVKFPEMELEFYNEVNYLLQDAGNWCLRVEALYSQMEVHAVHNSKGDTTGIGIFQDNFEQIVYEFIDDLETAFLGSGTNKQRGQRVWAKHLSESLKTKLINKSDDFIKIKEYLIAEYGRPDRIVNDIVAGLLRKKKPASGSGKEKLLYYSDILCALQRVEKLHNGNQIDSVRLNECLVSRGTLSTLMSLLPDGDFEDFTRLLTREKMDWNNPNGQKTLDLFKEFCQVERNAMESARTTETGSAPKVKNKGVHSVQKKQRQKGDSSSEEEQEQRVHAVNKQWHQPGLKFPCPLTNHKHELSKCPEFLLMSPEDRWNNIERRKICYTCLQPKSVCVGRRCSSQTAVPKILLCTGCETDALAKGWAPLNILLCRKREHGQLRAPWGDIKLQMEKYFGKLPQNADEGNVKVQCNFLYTIHAASSHTSETVGRKSAESNIMEHAPLINSCTGERLPPEKITVIPETLEHSFYMMQELKIGNSDCLAFFDSGSNAHLLDGELAERENLQIVSKKRTAISVVGGNQIKTEYGTYRFSLGPNDTGEFYELSCLGMGTVSGDFAEYDLREIQDEYYENGGTEKVLPMKVGGSRVHLLIGIKNTHLSPTLIEILPSGVGVYKSPFKDKYGSRIIFAGPHPVFTKGNKNISKEIIQAVFACRKDSLHPQREAEDELGEEPDDTEGDERKVVFSIMTNKRLGMTVHPHPINETDMIDAGCSIPIQFEEIIDAEGPPELVDGNIAHFCSVHKAVIPIARMREMVDQDDLDDMVTFRCAACSKCLKCKMSRKRTAVSLQETVEQEIIEKSVTLSTELKKVVVKLAFTKDPTEFLKKKHGANNNYFQAVKVYKTQCRKPEPVKEEVRKAHEELVDRNFMIKFDKLTEELKQKILSAPFLHYFLWRTVFKEDSISTPVRLVVDPTMSGLNMMLAKGENRIGSINDILIRTLAQPFSWSSDISKLYNQLHLEDSALPYSLFLYDSSLDENMKPQVWVMRVAWYGVTSTGAQAGEALDRIAHNFADQYPLASKCVLSCRYVDDLSPGAQSEEIRMRQIEEMHKMLGQFGLKLKYVVLSGEDPPDNATSDGSSVKLLGYKWNPRDDTIQLGFDELNLNKKIRGSKKPNEKPVITSRDAEELLEDVVVTRRIAVSKVAEIYDPLGWCEILKIQLKLELTKLNEFDWDEPIPETAQNVWKKLLARFPEFDRIIFQRNRIPADSESCSGIRLICMADAAKYAGGAIIYAGRKLKDGTWSCALITAKSKLMKSTIPRNELSAVMLMTELAFITKRALEDQVSDIIYLTDSTIAMSWCHNTNIKNKIFVRNRVETIRRLIEWSSESEEIPLYHIEGKLNIADLLTKYHEINVEDVTLGSVWQDGLQWMKLDTECMPIMKYESLMVSKDQQLEVLKECFEEPHLIDSGLEALHTLGSNVEYINESLDQTVEKDIISPAGILPDMNCKDYSIIKDAENGICATNESLKIEAVIVSPAGTPPQMSYKCLQPGVKKSPPNSACGGRGSVELIVDVVANGWFRSLRILNYVLAFVEKIRHKRSHKTIVANCEICTRGEVWEVRHMEEKSVKVLCRYETAVIKKTLKPQQVQRYQEVDEILYFFGRLTREAPFRTVDLDQVPFLDTHEFVGQIPVLLGDSPVLYSYLMAVHLRLIPHAGVEAHVKEVAKKFSIIGSLRDLVKKIIARCVKCRIREKKRSQLQISNHPSPRTVLAPPFYNIMVDIAYGFPGKAFKRARTKINIYALVIVCLMSGATNILALEGIETQDVVQAIERHGTRYGMPADVYIDQGTQLVALKHASFSHTDLDARLYDTVGIRVHISNAKAHTERGRVERKIGLIRATLEKTGVSTTSPMTAIQWETVFAKVASTLDDLPLAKGNTSNVSSIGFDIITPNRLKLGRNNNRSLDGSGVRVELNPNLTRILENNRNVYNTWLQLFIDNIHFLTLKPDIWRNSSRLPIIDDIVLFVYSDSGQGKESITWKLGKVVEVMPRKVKIQFSKREGNLEISKLCTLDRSIRDISILFSSDEFLINTSDHFQEISKK